VPKQYDPSRSLATQLYRATKAAQLAARRRRINAGESTVPLRPLTQLLSPETLATLAAIVAAEKRGRK
jgi:hypothetical protein